MMKRKNIVLFILSASMLLATAAASKQLFAAADQSETATVSASANDDEIAFSLPSATDGILVRYHANEYHASEDFLALYDGLGDDNQADGYTQDRNYYSTNAGGIIEYELNGETQFEISRYSTLAGEENWDKIFDKFYILADGTKEDGKAYGGNVVYGPIQVTDFDSQRSYAVETPDSIKGLEVVNYDDAEKLGVNYGIVGLDINGIQSSQGAADAIEYTFCGEKYYFSAKKLRSNDQQIKNMTDAGIQVTQSLLIYASNLGSESILAHPDFEKLPNFEMNMSGINTTEYKAIKTLAATCSFLAERYSREDAEYGRVVNYIVGNEVESACQWYNMGYLPIDEFVRQYERAVRIAYTAIKSVWSETNVLMCCSHFWTVDVATQYMNYDPESYRPFTNGKGSYTSREIIALFARESKRGGDYDWKLAYHPYRANAIGESVFWNAENYIASAHNENAAKVTPLNIDVLANFLKKEEIAYGNVARDYYVTEYGAGTPHGSQNAGDYKPDLITDQVLNEQVASYIYSYYMFYFNGAKAYMLHRHIDVSYESGENLGLWFRQEGSESDLYAKKPIWNVFKYIDTKYSLQYTTPYLQYITKYPSAEKPKSWGELIPNFDATKLEKSPVDDVFALTENSVSNSQNEGFENGETGGWRITDAATSATALADQEVANRGDYGLLVQYESLGSAGRGLAEKGIRYDFDAPTDLTAYDTFNFSVCISQETEKLTHTVKVRFYSGDHVAEFVTDVQEGKYVRCSADMKESGWQYFDKVDHIKIWYSSDSTEAQGGMLFFDDIGFNKETQKGCGSAIMPSALVTFALAATWFGLTIVRRRVKQ
ncbi:MAG: hypothetical protein IJ317_04495 [Clostridia bacterium]|nr:hypothetical protein [Clostridia bacterium]